MLCLFFINGQRRRTTGIKKYLIEEDQKCYGAKKIQVSWKTDEKKKNCQKLRDHFVRNKCRLPEY